MLEDSGDFISDFMLYTEGIQSTDLFRQWTGISLVAGACQRRVWCMTGDYQTFPNLYLFLVAPPGIGKQVINLAKTLIGEVPGEKFKLAPDSMTKASLMDELVKIKVSDLTPDGPVEFHSLYILAEEVGVFIPAYDDSFLNILNSLYNNPDKHEETRRHGPAREVRIPYPQVNMVLGVQPGWLASTFPENAWVTGLTSRIIMVYSPTAPVTDIFLKRVPNPSLRESLKAQLATIGRKWGEMEWSPAAAEKVRDWHMKGGPPAPTHSKLEYYCNRRTLHLTKLALVSAVSSGQNKLIREEDLDRAMDWLLTAEHSMPDIFRAMVGRSDAQVIEELHYYMSATWRTSGQKPIHEAALFSFVSRFVPAEKVERIIQLAERANVIVRVAGTSSYLPRAKHLHGME